MVILQVPILPLPNPSTEALAKVEGELEGVADPVLPLPNPSERTFVRAEGELEGVAGNLP